MTADLEPFTEDTAPLAPVRPLPVVPADDIDSWVTVAAKYIKLADYVCETEFVPKNYRGNAPATAAAMLAGRELGLPPFTALRHVHVVEGSPSLSAEYKRARVLAAGHELDIVELNTVRCSVSGRRRGSGKPPLVITFTIEDAKRANLLASRSGRPGAWLTRPRRMLFARAATEVCDFLFADITNGLPTTELLADGGADEFGGYAESPGQAPVAAARPEPDPKPAARSARRKTPAAADPQPVIVPPAAAGPAPGPDLPPLPGEHDPGPAGQAAADEPDESDYDTPGTVTIPMLTAIWTVLTEVYKFSKDEKDQARAVCAHIAGHPLESTKQMSRNEASAVLDTLANWREVAERHEEQPREFLIELLAAAAKQKDGESDE